MRRLVCVSLCPKHQRQIYCVAAKFISVINSMAPRGTFTRPQANKDKQTLNTFATCWAANSYSSSKLERKSCFTNRTRTLDATHTHTQWEDLATLTFRNLFDKLLFSHRKGQMYNICTMSIQSESTQCSKSTAFDEAHFCLQHTRMHTRTHAAIVMNAEQMRV